MPFLIDINLRAVEFSVLRGTGKIEENAIYPPKLSLYPEVCF